MRAMRNKAVLMLLLIPLLWSGTVSAQDQSQADPEPGSEQATDGAVPDTELTPEELTPEELTPEEPAAAENDEPVSDDEDASEQEQDEERTSARFIPTEQISQDLGVSFPVDI